MHSYSKKEIDYLREISLNKSGREIAEMFNKKFNTNVSESAITGVRKRYGITSGIDARFKKGQVPFNKGKKKYWIGGEDTQFKKGDVPHNYKPVGSERVNTLGYTDIKIADPGKWKAKHILMWESANGKVPKNHVVIFLDGDKTNVTMDNLVCISRRELVILNNNNLIKPFKELTETGILIANVKIKTLDRAKNV